MQSISQFPKTINLNKMFPPKSLLFLSFLLLISPSSAVATAARRLDDTAVPTNPDGTVKCAPCEENTPSPPPPIYPSPPPPSPPPPDVIIYYSPPPPKKEHKNPDCPPPPSPPYFNYITGPPGDLYPIDTDYNAAGRKLASAVVGLGLAGVLFL